LQSDGSLSRRLSQSFGGFKVQLLGQGTASATHEELHLLRQHGVRSCRLQRCHVREVVLWGDGRLLVHARSVLPAVQARLTWRALRGLGQRNLGIVLNFEHAMPASAEPADGLASATPGGAVFYPAAHATIAPADPDAAHKFKLDAGAMPAQFAGYAASRPEADGFDFRLISRRSKHRYNSNGHISEFLKKKMQTNPAFFHPDDLAALSLTEGDVIEITSRVASIHAVTKASDKVRRGVISMSHAWGNDDAGKDDVIGIGASTNRLIDDALDMDPITGMPVQSAIPVRVSAA
jgi:anaerobic selenocysteine-containing dehydrogenase